MDGSPMRHHDDVLVMFTRRNLLALAWYDAPRRGHLLAVLRAVEDLHATHGRYGLLNVVVRGTPSFPEVVREEGKRLIETTSRWRGVTAHVIEVEGFAGTATRMFLSTMMLMGRGRGADARVFATHPEGCAWLSRVLSQKGMEWSPHELEATYRDVRAIAPR